jgi:hypothetical protein
MWIHVPPEFCPSAQAGEDLNSDLASSCQALAQSATLRGKSLPARSWQRACEKVSFVKPLSGRILPHSTAQDGVERWISSLRDTPASPSASSGSARGSQTSDTSGLTSAESSASVAPEQSSARTWRITSRSGSKMLAENYEKWATLSRQAYSRRVRWALRTIGRGFSFWGTPLANPSGRGQFKKRNKRKLEDVVAWWIWEYSRRVPKQESDGTPLSKKTIRLNPVFATWLMNWPRGWTSPGLNTGSCNFTSWETASSQHVQRMLSLYFAHGWQSELTEDGSEDISLVFS